MCVFSIQMNMLYTMFLRCNHKMFLFSLSLSLKRILDSSPVPVTADMKDSRKRSRVFLFVLFLFFCHTLRLESILKLSSQCVTEIISYPYLTYTTVSKNDSGWRRSQWLCAKRMFQKNQGSKIYTVYFKTNFNLAVKKNVILKDHRAV